MRLGCGLVIGWLVLAFGTSAAGAGVIEATVRSGSYERLDTPLRVPIRADFLDNRLLKELATGPLGVRMREVSSEREPLGSSFEAQLDIEKREGGANAPFLTMILPGRTPPETERRFEFDPSTAQRAESPWRFSDPSRGSLELKNADRGGFTYIIKPISDPKYPEIPPRDAYLHPVYTPSGALITGDFMKSHPHHRGIFLAYTKTLTGELMPDFWNYHLGSGKIRFERLEGTSTGPVTAAFQASHRWEAVGDGDVLKERWEVEVFDIPGSPYWLFDLTSRQRAIVYPIELIPYRYGGMAYRGPEPFYHGKIDVLTSEGLDRVSGDQKPARWVDLTGPVEEGSDRFGGAMILDHPSNPNHPTVARIHPTTLPFFTYTPGHDTKVTIGTATETVFRYRIVVHDGHPDAALNERLWRDFAAPPVVTIARKAP